MPHAIPTSAIPLAIDGVLIRATCLGKARHADRIVDFAQAHARRLTDDAASTVADLRRQALEQGYLDGMSEAIAVVVGSTCDVAALGASLADRTMARAAERIRHAMRESGLEEALILKYCEAARDGSGQAAVLRMPEEGRALADALAPRLEALGIAVRVEGIVNPLLDVGPTAYEFVAEEAVLSHAMAASALSESHHVALQQLAATYAAKTIEALAASQLTVTSAGASS